MSSMIWEQAISPIGVAGAAATLVTAWLLACRIKHYGRRGKRTLPGPSCIPWLGPLPSRTQFSCTSASVTHFVLL